MCPDSDYYEKLPNVNLENEISSIVAQRIINNKNEFICANKFDSVASYVFVSNSIEGILGFKPQNLIGKSGYEFIHPDFIDLFKEKFNYYAKIVKEGRLKKNNIKNINEVLEFKMLNSKGNYVWVYGNFFIINNLIVSIARDISKIKQIEKDVEDKKRLFNAIFENANDGILIMKSQKDKIPVIYNANNTFLKMHDYSLDEITGKPVDLLDTKTNTDNLIKFNNKLLEGENLYLEVQHSKKDGTPLYLEIASFCYKESSENYIYSIVRDISLRKAKETAELEYTKNLEEKTKDLSGFSQEVAHDLKNPISNIISFTTLLKERINTASKSEILNYLDNILSSGQKSMTIIDNLLLLSSVNDEKVVPGPIDNDKILDNCLNLLNEKIKNKNLTISIPEHWTEAIGHAGWIEQVWINYLDNAIKYSPEGGNITISNYFDIQKNMSVFSITDEGNGISINNLPKLFNKYSKIKNQKISGHGIGLSLVKKIISRSNGEVWAESIEGKGSTFFFALPGRNITKKSYVSLKSGKQKAESCLLIAEDDEVSLILLKEVLGKLFSKVFIARNGNEAIEIFDKNVNIQYAILDLKMPGLNGFEVAKHIRKKSPNIFLIAQSAHITVYSKEDALKAGFNKYYSKPLDLNKIKQEFEIIMEVKG